jgi:Xaa-Pro aminopeptidase
VTGEDCVCVLLHGDTVASAALRHEVPLAIIDPFTYLEVDGAATILTNVLERERIAAVRPDAELLGLDELGLFELVEQGMARHAAELEVISRAIARARVRSALVPPDFPLAVADRLRADGVELVVDDDAFTARRRVKSPQELAGIMRAQRAAEAGMAAAAALLRGATPAGGRLELDGAVLTAERVRAELRATCAEAGAPAPADVLVTSALSGGGHDPGSGPLPAALPIVIDLWPQDEESGCWADMTRTFVVGQPSDDVLALHELVGVALAAARSAIRPGRTGREIYDVAAEVFEQAGHATQRTRAQGESLTHGFYFALGHGVGLEVHEPPTLGLAVGEAPLVAGDVLALEPGIEGLPGIGGVRFEDLVLVTKHGCETLTDYPYALTPDPHPQVEGQLSLPRRSQR